MKILKHRASQLCKPTHLKIIPDLYMHYFCTRITHCTRRRRNAKSAGKLLPNFYLK